MKKLIMILAGLAMIGATVLGVINKNDIDAVYADLVDAREQVRVANEQLVEAEDKREAATEEQTQATDARNQALAAVEQVREAVRRVERSLEGVDDEMKKIDLEQREIDLLVRRQFPDGNIRSPDDLNMQLTMLKETLSERQARRADAVAQMQAAEQNKQTQVARVREEEQHQVQRAQRVALNGMVATVIAVNREWGFVMVNAGRAHGISPDASLLVMRGNSRIGRLRIVTLEETSVVADVVDELGAQSVNVQPGDKVIFENVN